MGEVPEVRPYELPARIRRFAQGLSKVGFHERLTAHERLEMLVDSDEAFQTIAPDMVSTDPLGFVRGGVSYDDHLKKYRESTGLREAVYAGLARWTGAPYPSRLLIFGSWAHPWAPLSARR